MERRIIGNAEIGTVLEHYKKEVNGWCKECGLPIVKVIGSDYTQRPDSIRYRHIDDTEGWDLYRCSRCNAPVEESFQGISETQMSNPENYYLQGLEGNIRIIVQ